MERQPTPEMVRHDKVLADVTETVRQFDGWTVTHTGIETRPELCETTLLNFGIEARKVRSTPDAVVHNTDLGVLFPVEVKAPESPRSTLAVEAIPLCASVLTGTDTLYVGEVLQNGKTTCFAFSASAAPQLVEKAFIYGKVRRGGRIYSRSGADGLPAAADTVAAYTVLIDKALPPTVTDLKMVFPDKVAPGSGDPFFTIPLDAIAVTDWRHVVQSRMALLDPNIKLKGGE